MLRRLARLDARPSDAVRLAPIDDRLRAALTAVVEPHLDDLLTAAGEILPPDLEKT